MSGVLLYREYLLNVRSSIINYELPEIKCKDVKSILEIAKDIEDLSYLNNVLVSGGSNGLFDKDKEFLRKTVRLESKLMGFMDVEDIESIISLESLYDVEDNIIEFCGDLVNPNNEINYKNLNITHLSLGDNEEELGANKFKTFQKEIEKVFGVLDNCKRQEVERNNEGNMEDKVLDNVNDVGVEDFVNDGEDVKIKTIPVIEENTVIEGVDEEEIGDIDEWVSQQDREIIEKYKDREAEGDYFEDEEIEIFSENIFSDNLNDNDILFEEKNEEDIKQVEDGDIEEVEDDDIEEVEDDDIERIEKIEEVKLRNKKEKLVNHAAVTEVDDVLAKMILAANDGIIKIPKSAIDIVGKVKNNSKRIYTSMKVDDEGDDF